MGFSWGSLETMPGQIASRSAPAALAVGLLCWACGGADGPAPEPYLADLARLEAFTATTYANFEWALTEGGVDPVALHHRAERAIRAATSDEQAVAALHDFVGAFADGHFRLRPMADEAGAGEGDEPAAPGPETPSAEACAMLGYEEHDQSFKVDFGAAFRPATPVDDPLPAGWLDLAGSRVGILRIDEFGANRFGEYCPAAWEDFRSALDGACDGWECTYAFRLAVVDRLLDEIAGRIQSLREQGIAALVVDITGNGGGSDWVHAVAGMLTDRTLVGSGRSVVRHPHWQGVFGEMLADLDRDLGRDDLTPDQRRLLEEVRGRLEEGMREAAEVCDLGLVWKQGAAELPCTLLVKDKLYTTGLVSEPPRPDTAGLSLTFYKALEYGPRRVAWDGPLALLIDPRTGSAAELFAALLRDNDAATLIGEDTFGVGCGYTNGGIQTVLEHSRLEVWVPDCVRHRRGGGNERAGVQADLDAVWVPALTRVEQGTFFVEQIARWLDTL